MTPSFLGIKIFSASRIYRMGPPRLVPFILTRWVAVMALWSTAVTVWSGSDILDPSPVYAPP